MRTTDLNGGGTKRILGEDTRHPGAFGKRDNKNIFAAALANSRTRHSQRNAGNRMQLVQLWNRKIDRHSALFTFRLVRNGLQKSLF